MPDHDTLVIYILAFFGAVIAVPPLALSLAAGRRKAKDPALPYLSTRLKHWLYAWLASATSILAGAYAGWHGAYGDLPGNNDDDLLLGVVTLAVCGLFPLILPPAWQHLHWYEARIGSRFYYWRGKLLWMTILAALCLVITLGPAIQVLLS